MAIKVFLDANIILEYILKREKYNEAAVIFQSQKESKVRLFVSSSVLHIVGYYLTKNLGVKIAKLILVKFLDIAKVIDANHNYAIMALESDFLDIEDAIQYYTALKNRMDYLITFDKDFQKFSSDKLEILNPQIFAQMLSKI
ncbi:type II toxin-antitoxin system VapC family toxin [Pelobium manganitolerans]|uniref:type II toxin-antitoxin system VapC family toxin n=1 Tax=Pelobium manganitolerans TaxID=1842495 RepID=UPI003FA3DBFF